MKIRLKEKNISIIYVILIAFISLFIAIIQPENSGPDEEMKISISKYIAENGTLPHGTDEAVREKIWGTSYAFTPILSYMIGAVFIKITSLFTLNAHAFYVAVRLVSVICYTIMTVFVIKIGGKLFKDNLFLKWIFILFVTILPQMTFIGTYINNDSLALMSISIIVYAYLRSLEDKFSLKTCIMLAFGLGICFLSYYNAYGYILTSVIIYVTYSMLHKVPIKKFITKGIIISLVTMLICAWWFIRNASLYDGDFLGLRSSDECAEMYAREDLKPSNLVTPEKENISIITMIFERKWLWLTIKSFIAVFGYMSINMHRFVYIVYILLFLLGIVGAVFRFINTKNMKENIDNTLLNIIFGINIIVPIILSLYYSYASDFQPQGRYVMPALIPLMYFIVLGIDYIISRFTKEKVRKKIQISLISVYVILFIICMIKLISVYI
ncbi:MAG: DUF2142 domain-containing protein [Clostridia bacterium]|nr:DUF2142 domain-containing protein [Clostridia bacterium]